MKVNKSRQKEIEKALNEKCKIGMLLTLRIDVLTCIKTEESSYGLRYVFDNELSLTKSNILSNIINCESKDQDWWLI